MYTPAQSPIAGLSEQEWIDVVNRVAMNHRQKTFDFYCPQDIEQEVWIIALRAAPAFKMPKARAESLLKAVEHWLNRVVSTRLTNLYRDRFAIKQKSLKKDKSSFDQELRHKLVTASSLDASAFLVAAINVGDVASSNEAWDRIYQNISLYGRELLHAVLAGESIPTYYKNRLMIELRAIMGAKQ